MGERERSGFLLWCPSFGFWSGKWRPTFLIGSLVINAGGQALMISCVLSGFAAIGLKKRGIGDPGSLPAVAGRRFAPGVGLADPIVGGTGRLFR